jgi:homoserine O-acetyltransferase
MNQKHVLTIGDLDLESGETLTNVELAYNIIGNLSETKDNVVLICHGLTASSDVSDWWPEMVGDSKVFDPTVHCIICINTIGSVYGSTGPRSINPETQAPYGTNFPFITVKDTVKAYQIFLRKLHISSLAVLVGASFGGYQALELSLLDIPINKLILLVTSAEESTWGRALHTAQRMAIEADETFLYNTHNAGEKGLEAARAIGMISYRGNEGLHSAQKENEKERKQDFKIDSYLRYQGKKLAKRFHAHAYYTLSLCMDSHNIARGRRQLVENCLAEINAETLVIGIDSDILNPPKNQKHLAKHIPNSTYHEITSKFGHDGFLVEHESVSRTISAFLEQD